VRVAVFFQSIKFVDTIEAPIFCKTNDELFRLPDTLSENVRCKSRVHSSNLAQIITGQTPS